MFFSIKVQSRYDRLPGIFSSGQREYANKTKSLFVFKYYEILLSFFLLLYLKLKKILR